MEFVVSLSAAVTAFAALGISLWQGIEMRMHNRLSARPHMRFEWDLISSTQRPKAQFRVTNAGPGAAIIRSFDLILDEETLSGDDATTLWRPVVDRFWPGSDHHRWTAWAIERGDILAAGEVLDLLILSAAKSQDEMQAFVDLQTLRGSFAIAICYCSVYDECWQLHSSGETKESSRCE